MPIAASAAPPHRGPEAAALPLFAAWWAITLGWWALAFLQVTPATPAWLARTQSVCFGNLSNGLPDAYGWTRLLLAPLGMLLPLLVVHGAGIVRGLRALGRRGAGRLALAVLVALPLAEGWWVGGRVQAGLAVELARTTLPRAGEPLPAHYPRLNRPAPDIRLLDQRGAPVALSALRGQVLLLTFAFAHCTATCPLTVRSLVQAAAATGELGARPVVVTLDPWRDTPSALGGVARQWRLPPDGLVLSGSVAQVLDVLARYELPTQRDERTGDVAHPALVYVIDREGRIAYLLNNPPPDWIVSAARRAAAG
jgi:cytochrome oxidase Cu insertion factor (SCO1/SenC/PrrC family)